MAKFQHLIGIIALFYSLHLITTSETAELVIPTESKIIYADDADLKLRFVSTVFRHGDRVIDRSKFCQESYPNDPYRNKSFYPDGDGQLTNNGKRRAYKLGLKLKNKYNNFLGDVYYPPNVYARSTEWTRTKMTLQLVLAALYPPINRQKWNEQLSWQPMDLIYAPQLKDDLLFPIICPKYQDIFSKQLENPEVKKKIEEFSDLMTKMSNYTGYNITNPMDLARLYNTLYAEFHMDLTLPKWTKDVFPNGALSNAACLFLDLLSYGQLNNLNGGVLLNRIIDDMNQMINGTLSDRKINLFSAHDITVSALLHALNIPERNYPEFTSSVFIELYEKHQKYFVKVLYYLGIPQETLEVRIPGCEMLCPYDKFITLTESSTAFKQPCRDSENPEKETQSTLFASLF